jgi:ribonuclease P protein component
MLSAGHRLRAADDFRTTVRKGVRVGRPLVVVHALPSSVSGEIPATEETRAGFVVSRSVGTAVVRNAVKRRLRHLVRERLDLLPPGARIVVRAQPEAAHAPSAALARDLDSAFDRLVDRMAA